MNASVRVGKRLPDLRVTKDIINLSLVLSCRQEVAYLYRPKRFLPGPEVRGYYDNR